MSLFFIPRINYIRKVFLFTHLTGLITAALILSGTALVAGSGVIALPTVLLCIVVGYLSGSLSYLFVQYSLARQLRHQLDLLQPLIGKTRHAGMNVEQLLQQVESSVSKVDDSVKTVLGTVDAIQPHYNSVNTTIVELADRARIGLEAAEKKKGDVTSMAEKQRQVMDQMQILTSRTQEEAALSRELSASLEEMADAMEQSSSQFYETTATVEEMAASVREVTTQAGEVGRSVGETSRYLDSIGAALEKIRNGSNESAETSEKVRADAESGLSIVESSLEEMELINTQSNRATEAMKNLSVQMGEVETIIAVIKDLVSDTELLAFNAAIIAAQAGEEGKGFSVVAEEIRDLADRTANSATDIHSIIQGIGKDTGEMTAAVEATARQIGQGRSRFHSTGEALRKIVTSSNQAALSSKSIAELTEKENERGKSLLDEASRNLQAVQSIVQAMKEQEAGVLRIEHGVEEMKAATDRIGRGMDEQVKANQSFNKGLLEREEQAQQVSEATRFQMEITEKVTEHFNTSQDRLEGNVTMTETLKREFATVQELTARLRDIVERLESQEQSRR